MYEKVISNLRLNQLDVFLKKQLSKQYFDNNNLYEIYHLRGFNYHCQIGSFICCLNLSLPCNLVRGELISNVSGKTFHHGWIETIYRGKEYVIDTTFAKAIPKDLYYLLLSTKIFQIINRNNLFINKYALYLKKALTKKNNLSLKKVYSAWWQYEDNWLMNIDDNTLLKKKKNTISLRKTKQS